MKKIYALLAGVMVAGSAFAQRATSTVTSIETVPAIHANAGEMTIDTISPIIACASPGGYLVGSTNGGYISGTNGYNDAQKGILNLTSSPVQITDILVFFGAKEAVTNGSISAYVHNFDTTATSLNAAMGNAIATSSAVSIANVDTTGGFTVFNFASPATVNGAFAITVQVDNAGDTVGIVHTNDACGANLAIEQWDTGDWYQMSDASSWGADITFYMFAVTDNTVSTEENILDRQSARAFPSPANDNINITYHLNGNSEVTINIMDIQGRVVMTSTENQTEGRQFVEMNTSALSAGTYFYSVQSGSDVMSGKFVVRH